VTAPGKCDKGENIWDMADMRQGIHLFTADVGFEMQLVTGYSFNKEQYSFIAQNKGFLMPNCAAFSGPTSLSS